MRVPWLLADNPGVTILAAVACGWVALILLAPWLPVPLAAAVYLFGAQICHQIPERSFVLDGVQLPVCARCLGIYAGAALATIVPCPLHAVPVRTAILVALMVNVVTLAGVSNAIRVATGAALGIVVACAVRQALSGTVDYERCRLSRARRSALPESRI
jgi:uncharacterized membrane protein